jgi:hypothetical protein
MPRLESGQDLAGHEISGDYQEDINADKAAAKPGYLQMIT